MVFDIGSIVTGEDADAPVGEEGTDADVGDDGVDIDKEGPPLLPPLPNAPAAALNMNPTGGVGGFVVVNFGIPPNNISINPLPPLDGRPTSLAFPNADDVDEAMFP